MYRCLTKNAPVYFNCVIILMLCRVLIFYGTRSNVNGNLYVPNVKRQTFKQSLLYMGPVIWNNLPSFLKSASSLDGFKNLYKRLLRNWRRFLLNIFALFPCTLFLLGAGEEYNFCNQPTQDKYIDK